LRTRAVTRWLGPEEAAHHLSVRPDCLARLVRQGRIPRPNYALGPRSPRWDVEALDAAFSGGIVPTDPREAIEAHAKAIIEKGRTGR
jgi:hypothetical protein